MNNTAVICRIKNIRDHSNADKVQLGTACGYQVVVGLNVKENDLGIYFPTDTCLGTDFAVHNSDLLTYFGTNCRVRTQKFRGENSEGFWVGIDSLKFINKEFVEGEELNKVGEFDVCYKYINPQTLQTKARSINQPKKLRSGSLPTFQKHLETSHLRKEWNNILKNYSDVKWVWTYKVHGTSQRVGLVLTPIEVNLCKNWVNILIANTKSVFRKLSVFCSLNKGIDKLSSFTLKIANSLDDLLLSIRKKVGFTVARYEYLIGTRNVILGELKSDGAIGKDGFYSDNFRKQASDPFIGNLHKGEVVYYEVVGYSAFNTPIMAKHHANGKSAEQKEISKVYGKEPIIYSYNCMNGRNDIYVYRIAYQTEDGISIDLTWDQVVKRCKELGVKHVPEAVELTEILKTTQENIPEVVTKYIDRPDPIDNSHPLEGVVLRIDSSSPSFYKEKSFTFKVLEGLALDVGEVDLEEAS